MTYKPGRHVYLAAPFFNDQQKELCTFLESLESELQPIYSPRKDGFVLRPDATVQEKDEIFRSNTVAIDVSYFVLAVIDDFDPGVIWEIGYAFARGKDVLAYSDVPGRGLNVMLAGSCRGGFVNGREEIEEVFFDGSILDQHDILPRNTWGGQVQ